MKKLNGVYIRSVVLLFVALAGFYNPVMAGMEPLDDAALDRIKAARGFSLLVKDVTFSYTLDSYTYTDTDTGNSLALNDLSWHDGAGGPVYFDSGDEAITFDILTINNPAGPIDGKTFFAITIPDWRQDYHISVDHFVFCNTDLGRTDTGNINMPYSAFYFTGHGHGLDWELDFELNTEETAYTYNTAGDSLTQQGIYWAQTAAGAPETPDDWVFTGPFAIGDINNDNSAKLDVITLTDTNTTSLLLNIPMRGVYRIKDVSFGGSDFGPIAIDGIRVHRLHVMIKPGVF